MWLREICGNPTSDNSDGWYFHIDYNGTLSSSSSSSSSSWTLWSSSPPWHEVRASLDNHLTLLASRDFYLLLRVTIVIIIIIVIIVIIVVTCHCHNWHIVTASLWLLLTILKLYNMLYLTHFVLGLGEALKTYFCLESFPKCVNPLRFGSKKAISGVIGGGGQDLVWKNFLKKNRLP